MRALLSLLTAALFLLPATPAAAQDSDESATTRSRASRKKRARTAMPVEADVASDGEFGGKQPKVIDLAPIDPAAADAAASPSEASGEPGPSPYRETRATNPDEESDDAAYELPSRERRLARLPVSRERLSGIDEPGIGLGAELTLGGLYLPDGTGQSDGNFVLGGAVVWQLGRMFAPENELIHNGLFLEASYHWTSTEDGTTAVRVTTGYHHLSAAVLFGYPFQHVLLYGKVGPSMFLVPVNFTVQGGSNDILGITAGAVYGVGARSVVYLNDSIGLSGRLELVNYRRRYLDDTLIAGAVGLVF